MKQIAPEYLSPEAFEQFATDLVQRMFNRKMYSFSEGKDEGIDAIDNVISPTLILQAKRYQVRTASATIMKTVDTEIKKIKKTGERYHWDNFAYVFVTSSGLLPKHREILRSKYPSLFISDDYIIDKPQLDRLSRDKEYEELFAQYGLIGKNLMEQVREFNLKSIEFESQFYFTEFRQNYFVETQAFDKAYDTVSTGRIIILSGNPGVGKSTSSRMLGLLFSERLDNDYYVLERSINEIQSVIDQYIAEFKESKTNLVVVFDDFLGRNTLDASDD